MSKQSVEKDGKIFIVDTDKGTYEEAKPADNGGFLDGLLFVATGGVASLFWDDGKKK